MHMSQAKLNVAEPARQSRQWPGPRARARRAREGSEQRARRLEGNREQVRELLSRQFCRCSGVMLSMRNKTAQPRVSLTAHAHYVSPGQTDTRTNGHTDTRSDELPLNDQMWGSLTLTPN